MAENTHYGLKNNLSVEKVSNTKTNLFSLECSHHRNKKSKVYLHILFLSEEIVRFHYSKSAKFDLKQNKHIEFDNFKGKKNFEKVNLVKNFQRPKKAKGSSISLETKELKVKINSENLSIEITDKKKNLLSEDLIESGFWTNGKEVRSYKTYYSHSNPPIIYGLGDKTGRANRWGKRYRNSPIDALGYDSEKTDPLYKDIPFFIHMDPKSKIAHGIFFDNPYDKFFDFGQERKPSPYYYFGAENGELNYYFIAGPKIKDVTRRYLELTGKPNLMPKFSFGYLASGMAYTEESNSSKRILDFFKKANKDKIFPSAFHLSSGYTLNKNNKRMQFDWNKGKFPSPKSFANDCLEEHEAELCANLKPVFLTEHPLYKNIAKKKFFLKENKNTNLVSSYWGGLGSYFDFSNVEAQKWWKKQLIEAFYKNKVRGIWNDNNEYEVFETHSQEENKRQMPYLMSKLAHDAYLEFQKSNLKKSKVKRPWVLSRSGYSGIQKYAQTWTGDNCSSFHALQFEIPIVSSMGLSGLIHTGPDTGGFYGEAPNSELLTRWIQASTFCPRLCVHSYKKNPTEPWSHKKSHAKDFKIIQAYLKLRKQLIPYIYQANYKAHTEGLPIQRPTVMDYQSDMHCAEQNFEYIFGDSLLVAPVYKEKEKKRKLYLPANETWIDFWKNREFKGGSKVEYPCPMSVIPLFVKANSIIPLEKSPSSLELNIFLSKDFSKKKSGSISYSFYEDDGDTLSYMDGEFLLSEFKVKLETQNQSTHLRKQVSKKASQRVKTKLSSASSKQGKSKVKISLAKESGKYKSPYQSIAIKIISGSKSKSLRVKRSELKKGVFLEL